MTIALINFCLIVYGFWQNYSIYDTNFQLQESYSWFPQIGLTWSLGVDGLSMPLIVLSGLISTLAILASWQVEKKIEIIFLLIVSFI